MPVRATPVAPPPAPATPAVAGATSAKRKDPPAPSASEGSATPLTTKRTKAEQDTNALSSEQSPSTAAPLSGGPPPPPPPPVLGSPNSTRKPAARTRPHATAQLRRRDNIGTEHTALKDLTNQPVALPAPPVGKGIMVLAAPSSDCTGEAQSLSEDLVTSRPLRAPGEKPLSITRALKNIACDNLEWASVEGGVVRRSMCIGRSRAHT